MSNKQATEQTENPNENVFTLYKYGVPMKANGAFYKETNQDEQKRAA